MKFEDYLRFAISYQTTMSFEDRSKYFIAIKLFSDDNLISYNILDLVNFEFYKESDFSTSTLKFKQKDYIINEIEKCKILHFDKLVKIREINEKL